MSTFREMFVEVGINEKSSEDFVKEDGKKFMKDFNIAVSNLKADFKDSPQDVKGRLEYLYNLIGSQLKKL